MRLRKAVVALFALLLPGCGEKEPNLDWIQSGNIEVIPEEREALGLIFAEVDASSVRAVVGEGPLGASRAVQIVDKQVVGLATWENKTLSAANRLYELRRLVLHRTPLRSLEGLGPWPNLRELRLEFSDLESLTGLEICCPHLESLSLSHGSVNDLSPLAGTPRLQKLRLGHLDLPDLASLPPLAGLKSLHLDTLPLSSVSDLEAYPALVELQLFGIKTLERLDDLPPLPQLRELRLFQNGLIAISGLPVLPRLETLEASDNRLLSLHLAELPALREVEVHEKDLFSVELDTLPSLEQLDLRGEGSLFQSGSLAELRIAVQPKLEQLDLRRNHLQKLDGLAAQPRLRNLKLDRNPFHQLERLTREDFPDLRHVSVHRTRVEKVPDVFAKVGISVGHDPNEIEANAWEGVLRRGFEATSDVFVEKLPLLDGSVRKHQATCTLRTATFSTPRLNCTLSMEAVSGLVHVYLAKVDPLSPASGGPNTFPVRATIRTRSGRARVYLKYRLNIRGQAEALAGYRDRERPWIMFGEPGDAESVKDGYVFAEARPDQPGTVSGEAHVLVDRLVIWVEGEDAEGIELSLTS